MGILDEVLDRVGGLDPEARAKVEGAVEASLGSQRFIPSPGPQSDGWFSKADVLLYGGSGGSGKSGLLCGLALEQHQNSLIMRRNGVDMHGGGGIIAELLKLYGSRDGYSGASPPTLRMSNDRIVTFGSATNVGDEQKYQGRARDFLGIDEATQFTEDQVRFLMGWVRTDKPGQRTRTVFATNPPINNTGDWIIGMFRPWLDITHPNPAEHGELRWFVTVATATGTEDIEVDGPQSVEIGGELLSPISRTFIPGRLTDNPFINHADYQRQLDALPEPYRSSVRDGNFMAARADDQWQVIPTSWIREAQERWTEDPPEHAPMTALAVDPAQGGTDSTVVSARYDAWFAPLSQTPGVETPTGNEVAGIVVASRRNGATIIVDMGGGYGGATAMRLKDNGIDVVGHKGSEAGLGRTADKQFGFFNNRAKIYWRFREALDPGQDGGSRIALPQDPEMVSDLTALRYEITSRGIKVTPKDEVVKELGRSPDKGDAVVMCNGYGPALLTHGNQWRDFSKSQNGNTRGPKVVMNRTAARRGQK